ncbi:MAG: hypothetical protein Q9209_001073 [Squamulea sp. 1 TL-2023]
MAPFLNIIAQLIPSLPGVPKTSFHAQSIDHQPILDSVDQRQQQPIGLSDTGRDGSHTKVIREDFLSTISWGENRLDIFALVENNLTHKYWDGYQWAPSGTELETLGNGLATPPVAVTWGVDRLDIFGLDDHDVIKHQYWDGTAWQPKVDEFENLGGKCDPVLNVAATTWGQDRLDLFCKGYEGELLHQYYDGFQWQPSVGSLESLGGSLASMPSVVSWGKDRLDVFGVAEGGELAHLYRDGSQWSKWELLSPSGVFPSDAPLTVTSWGENRLHVYAVARSSELYHIFWDGSQWSAWEILGARIPYKSVAATSWSVDRHDIVIKAGSGYYYKFWDGHAWRPDVFGWYEKSPDLSFISSPSVVSWGDNRFDIFGIDDRYQLVHQAWVGDSWYPSSTGWETLAEEVI